METKQVVFRKTSLQTPLRIVQFSHASAKLKTKKCLQYQSFKSSELNALSRPKQIIVASNKTLEYAGSNYESEISKITSSLLKVGVYNKNTGKIKLFDVDFYNLSPILKESRTESTAEDKSWKEKAQDLTLAFGSKNRQKAVSLKLKFESTENQMNATVPSQFIDVDINTQIVQPTQYSEIIPHQNKLAKSAEEVYNLHDIISQEEYDVLDDKASIFVGFSTEDLHTWKEQKQYCPFILFFLEVHSQNITLNKAKMLCFLDYMIIFMKKTYQEFRKKDPVPEIPQPFRKNLMANYLVNRNMPSRMKDKILAHAMVLALMVNNYHIDGAIWALSTQIPIKRLILIAYALGCHVSERKNQETKLIELKLPLYKYVPMKGKRNKN